MNVDVSSSTPQMVSCCSSVGTDVLGEGDAAELAVVLKALAEPARLRLLSMIASAPSGEACACDLLGPIGRSQPTVSHHLSAMVEAGLLEREKRGRWAWYRVVPERLRLVRDAIDPDATTRA